MTFKELAEKYKIRLIVQFGSSVTGKTHQLSDFDIAYLSAAPLDFAEKSELVLDLAVVLNIPIDKIDLTNINNASPLLLKEIFKTGQPFFQENNETFDRYKIYSSRLFDDSAFIFKDTERFLREKAKQHKASVN